MYDLVGLEPNYDAEPVMIKVRDYAPYGAELARCYDSLCTNEVPEVLDYDTEYNAYEGWYIVKTTAKCYEPETGDIKLPL